MRYINYYTPTADTVHNRAKTALVTIDWFKKKFRLPIDSDLFICPYSEGGETWTVPLCGNIVNLPFLDNKTIQGVVESVIIDKVEEDEEIHILIKPFDWKNKN